MDKKLILFWLETTTSDERMKIYKNNVDTGSYTGTANETKFDSVLIPANTFQANDVVRIVWSVNKTGTGGTLTVRCKANTTNDLAGSPVTIATQVGTGATIIYFKGEREMQFKNSIAAQQVYVATVTGNSDVGQLATFGSTGLTINFAVDQYIIITGQNTGTGDTQVLSSWYIEVFR